MADQHQMMSSPQQPVELPASTPVEMGNLSAQAPAHEHNERQAVPGAAEAGQEQEHTQSSSNHTHSETTYPPTSGPIIAAETPPQASGVPPISIPPAALTRTETEAIGPSTDLPTPMLSLSTSALGSGPVIQFTLLLASTGTRHPYQINEKYLAKRGVKAEGDGGVFDPTAVSVYTLKELIWKDWRDDWDARPSSPSSIRLIYFGRLLTDSSSLKDCKFHSDGTANVLHVTIKPQEIIEDEEAAKGGKNSLSRDRDGAERTPGCRCVIL